MTTPLMRRGNGGSPAGRLSGVAWEEEDDAGLTWGGGALVNKANSSMPPLPLPLIRAVALAPTAAVIAAPAPKAETDFRGAIAGGGISMAETSVAADEGEGPAEV